MRWRLRNFLLPAVLVLLALMWGCREDEDTGICTDCAEISSFTFLSYNNVALSTDVNAVIGSDRVITVHFPANTNLTSLIPNFIHTGKEVLIGNRVQVSGQTICDFSKPVKYMVVALDGSSAEYTVIATKDPSTDNTLTFFGLKKADNPGLPSDITFVINQQKKEIRGSCFRWIDGDPVVGMIPSFETGAVSVSVEGKTVTSGITAISFKEEFTLMVEAETGVKRSYLVKLLSPQVNATLPVLKIDADGPIDSKEVYQTASLQIFGNGIQEGLWSSSENGKKVEIRLRGNSTLGLPKKPYRIKFPDKYSPLGLNHAKEKSWVLLANDADKSLLRNAVAFRASEILLADNARGAGFTAATRFVDIYLDGIYIGNYHLTDQVEVAPGRVAVQSLKASDGSNPVTITGGYLLEIDGFAASEPLHFITHVNNIPVTIKYPKDDNYHPAQVDYVSNLFGREAEGALFAADFADPVKGWRKYFDEKTWVDYFIISEITGNSDAWWSTYIYKFRDDPLFYFGPVWDFDIAFNNDNRLGDARLKLMADAAHQPRQWVNRLREDPGFRKAVKERWNLKKGELRTLVTFVDQAAESISMSQEANFSVWDIREQKLGHAAAPPASHEVAVRQLREYLEVRWNFLDGVFKGW